MFDIYVVTFNRLIYLQKCIWSILAGTKGKYRIVIIDDGSTDGTRQWIGSQERKGLPITHIFPKAKLGTANAFNMAINSGKGDWFCFANDDMWFHRFWLDVGMEIVKNFPDCGYVSLYDYTATRKNIIKTIKTNKVLGGLVHLMGATGLGATIMYRPLWLASGGFRLPKGVMMGFFATTYCQTIAKTVNNVDRKQLYMPGVPFVHNMDLVASPLQEREALAGYGKMRSSLKGTCMKRK